MRRLAKLLVVAAATTATATLAAPVLSAQQPAAAGSARADTQRVALPAAERAITLAEAVQLAERVQPQVVQAQGTVRNAEARVRSAKGAYLPNLNVSSNGSQTWTGESSRLDQNTGQLISGTTRSINTSVSASVDLFTGFRRGAESRAAGATSDAAEASLVNARFQQALTTTNQFFDALATQELVEVRAASVRRAEEQLKISVAKLQAGSATRSDSLRSLVTLGTARLELIQALAQLADAEANLGRLVGVSGRVRATGDSSFFRQPVIDTVAVRAEAEQRSPQVQSAVASARAADAAVSAAKAAYWPTLSLGGSTSWSGDRQDNYALDNRSQLTLGLSWNIFNRFQREQQVTAQEVNAELAQAQSADAARQVQASVTAQLAQLDAAQEQIRITQTSVTAAREDLRVQQERYRLGASTIVDLLTSQEALNQAEVDVVNARFAYLRAKAQLEALIGRAL